MPVLEKQDIWLLEMGIVDKDNGCICIVSKFSYQSLMSIKSTKNPSPTMKEHYNRQGFVDAFWRSDDGDRYVFGIMATGDNTVLNNSGQLF